jgi:hypothetical protein
MLALASPSCVCPVRMCPSFLPFPVPRWWSYYSMCVSRAPPALWVAAASLLPPCFPCAHVGAHVTAPRRRHRREWGPALHCDCSRRPYVVSGSEWPGEQVCIPGEGVRDGGIEREADRGSEEQRARETWRARALVGRLPPLLIPTCQAACVQGVQLPGPRVRGQDVLRAAEQLPGPPEVRCAACVVTCGGGGCTAGPAAALPQACWGGGGR